MCPGQGGLVSQAAGRYSAPEQSPEETSECVLFGWNSTLGKEQHLQTTEVGAFVAHFRKGKEIGGTQAGDEASEASKGQTLWASRAAVGSE